MIKRTVEISGHGNHLFISDGALCIRRGRDVVGRVPLEDLGVLILDAPTTTYTHRVITDALGAGAVILPCGRDHHPAAMFLPQTNSLQTQRVADQAAASLPLRKRLWQQIVRRKIATQADVLGGHPAAKALKAIVARVRSGDPSNIEAQAARRYWPGLFGSKFRRQRDGPCPNTLLNYAYMVLRACVARSLCAAGLHPSLGLHHHNRSNAFALADDLLEPLRPLADRKVKRLFDAGAHHIDRDVKIELLSLLTEEIEVARARGPLMVALERVVASLVRCYAGEQRAMELPAPCN
jgi:CRISPR-associated protein Cas1